MGAGGSPSFVDAPYQLKGPIPAGMWGIVGDGIVAGSQVQTITVRFEARWRKQGASDDSGDQILMAVEHTFVRDTGNPFNAVQFTGSAAGVAAAAAPGDLLVFRATALSGDPGAVYILNGDGPTRGGRIPRLDLPQ